MARSKRSARRSLPRPDAELLAFPTLLTLIAGMLVLAVFHLGSLSVAALAAAAAGLVGWLWWRRRRDRTAPPPRRARRGPNRR